MAEEHIRLAEKIYALPDLPYGVLSVRREAFGSANYIAGCVYGDTHAWAKKRYFLMALLNSPLKYLHEYRDRLPVIRHELRYGWRAHIREMLKRSGGSASGRVR
jgi:hypothetical protein